MENASIELNIDEGKYAYDYENDIEGEPIPYKHFIEVEVIKFSK
jgi:hypothetical protein